MLEYKQTISISPKFSIYIICQEYSAEQDGRGEGYSSPDRSLAALFNLPLQARFKLQNSRQQCVILL